MKKSSLVLERIQLKGGYCMNNIDKGHGDVFNSIKTLMDNARNEVAREVNNILVQTYWEIGRIIV